MESYYQPWTVVNKYESIEPKTYEYYAGGVESHRRPQYECPTYLKREMEYKWEKPEYSSIGEKPEWGYKSMEKPEWSYYKGEKPQYQKKHEQQLENIYGGWEKVCDNLERWNLEKVGANSYEGRYEKETIGKGSWKCGGKKCCDEEMVKQIKNMINIFIGAEQSYVQLGFLCMDEKFTLVNTSEYFRLCGLRMRWMANTLIGQSVRLFNVHEWINGTSFENWFKVPSKEELATNDYTGIIKTFFKLTVEAETRLVEHMNVLCEKITKSDWVNSECGFEGCKWFVNFALPYQLHFVREINGHWRNIEMCDNGFIFDKCEMYPLVQKIEQFIHRLVKTNTFPDVNGHMSMLEKFNMPKKW